MKDRSALRVVSDDELLHRLIELVSQSRSNEADLVAHIGEVERRRLYAREAAPSMLILDNRGVVLARATHASKRQILELVAELTPRPDVPARMRKLPEAAHVTAASLPRPADSMRQLCPDTVAAPMDSLAATSQPASAVPMGIDELGAGVDPLAESASRSVQNPSVARRAIVEPLSPGRYKVQFTASSELREKLERLQALMRFQLPEGDLAAVIEAAVSEKLERLEARRFAQTPSRTSTAKDAPATHGKRTKAPATRKPASSAQPVPTIRRLSRHVPADIRRAVYERDEGQCRYVDQKGRRCTEHVRLEYHHHYPFGMGGSHEIGEIRLMCRSHNLLMAEQDYGPQAMAAYRLPM